MNPYSRQAGACPDCENGYDRSGGRPEANATLFMRRKSIKAPTRRFAQMLKSNLMDRSPMCRGCGRRDGTHADDCQAARRESRAKLQATCDHQTAYGRRQTIGEPPGPWCCGRCGSALRDLASSVPHETRAGTWVNTLAGRHRKLDQGVELAPTFPKHPPRSDTMLSDTFWAKVVATIRTLDTSSVPLVETLCSEHAAVDGAFDDDVMRTALDIAGEPSKKRVVIKDPG